MSMRGKAGFTLIELLIVIAIIGLLAAMLIPNMLEAMHKAKQKRTMGDMRTVGGAMMAWLTDQAAASAAGQGFDLSIYGSPLDAAGVSSLLVPQYIQEIPVRDGFKFPFEYYVRDSDPQATAVLAIRSTGLRGIPAGSTYTTGSFNPTDYEQDIVWADGFFIRWPQGLSGAATP